MEGALTRSLRDGAPLPRRWAGRLSAATAFAPCAAVDADSLSSLECDAAPRGVLPGQVMDIAGRATAAVRSGVDPDALHAAAILDLVTADREGNALDRSVSFLEMVTRLAPTSASGFVDLSAAYLARASRRADPRDLLVALEAASRAVELDPRDAAARFDRALALEALGIDGEAAKEWRAYLRRDSISGWASEARRRLAHASSHVPPATPDLASPADTLAAFAIHAPAEARALCWDRSLGEWGEAVLAGDSARAMARLRSTAAVGAALARRYGDSSVTDAVRAIDAVRRQPALARRLAASHVRYARAQARVRATDYAHADSEYTAVLAEAPPSLALRQWATVGHANALIYQGRPDDAERIVAALVRTVSPARDPALAARGLWILGILRVRRGRNDVGLDAIRRAAALFARLGDRYDHAGMIGIDGEVRLGAGDEATGFALLHRAVLELRSYPTSVWRHNDLFLVARTATAAGVARAAMAIEDEDAAASDAGGRPVSVVEARLARARVLWTAGEPVAARSAISAAARAIASLPAGDARDRFRAELQMTEAIGHLRTDPARSYALLDSVVAFFTPLRYPLKLIPAFVSRAQAALALGRADAAEADLDRAAALYEARRREIASLPEKAALLAQARSVFDGLVMLRLRGGRTLDALEALERSRASFSTSRSPAPSQSSARTAPPELGGPGARVVDYAVIGDTLVAWVVERDSTTVMRSTIDRARLTQAIERARSALELALPEEAIRPELARLYELLIRRLDARLGPDGSALSVIADDAIADVPFPALYDARRGRYLVESHATRTSATLREGQSADDAVAPRGREDVLLVADPVLDSRAFPSLSPLPGADAEVRAIAPLYRRAVVLAGAAAESASVASALPRASLFHFAGHALFNDARPERSALAVAPHGLSAAAIAALDLHRLRLVVLSACETVRSPSRRTGGFAGLTEAFRAAGAGGVVGSLWRVNDLQTATLMREFHSAYKKSGDPAEALRRAQVTLRHSPVAALRSPSAWGAFRYAGR